MNNLPEYVNIILILGAGFSAGAINAIAGGGSLITFPLLVWMGLPEGVANGSNRIAILFQTFFSVRGYKSKGVSSMPFGLWYGLAAAPGAFIGTYFASVVDGELFRKIFAFVMIAMVLIMIVQQSTRAKALVERTDKKTTVVGIIMFFLIGLYGGFIQAGVGIIMLIALSAVNRFTLVKSNAVKNLVVMLYTVVSIAIFHYYGLIDWYYALLLAIGNSIGGWLSARWAVKKGDKVIRIFMMIVVIALAVKLLLF